VRQGQISELINAKPKNRRRILEEAAGISGLYQRRHEAELKLKGAERTNLLRVEDVIEQLAQQLAQLARQAKQAARYREIGEELRAGRGHAALSPLERGRRGPAAAEEALRAALPPPAEAERARAAGRRHAGRSREEHLPPLREEAAIAGAVLQRLQVQQSGSPTRNAARPRRSRP
jgi:chromosome segregation protein